MGAPANLPRSGDTAFFRSHDPAHLAHLPPAVWAIRYSSRDDTIRYFLRDGTQCGPDGELRQESQPASQP